MDKDKNIKRAKEIFDAHSTQNTVHFSSDGSAFFSINDRNNHVRMLKDKATHSVDREDVYPSVSEADNDDDEQDFLIDKGAAAARAKIEAQYRELFGLVADPDKDDLELTDEILTKRKELKAAEDKDKADKKAAADKEKADKKAADDKEKADKKAAADKEKADKKAADDKEKADKKAAAEQA